MGSSESFFLLEIRSLFMFKNLFFSALVLCWISFQFEKGTGKETNVLFFV